MGVMLQRDSQHQRLYLNDVVVEKEASDFSQDDLVSTGSSEKNENLFMTSILQKVLNVKRQIQLDKEYMDAVKRGDMETAQRMVDEAASAAGYTTNGYHGSRTPGFTVADKYSWLWFARDEDVANGYGVPIGDDNNGKPYNKNGVYAMQYNLGNNLEIYADGPTSARSLPLEGKVSKIFDF